MSKQKPSQPLRLSHTSLRRCLVWRMTVATRMQQGEMVVSASLHWANWGMAVHVGPQEVARDGCGCWPVPGPFLGLVRPSACSLPALALSWFSSWVPARFSIQPLLYRAKSQVTLILLSSDFPRVPVAKTPCSQCRGLGFDSWFENEIPYATIKDPSCHSGDPVQLNK